MTLDSDSNFQSLRTFWDNERTEIPLLSKNLRSGKHCRSNTVAESWGLKGDSSTWCHYMLLQDILIKNPTSGRKIQSQSSLITITKHRTSVHGDNRKPMRQPGSVNGPKKGPQYLFWFYVYEYFLSTCCVVLEEAKEGVTFPELLVAGTEPGE